MCTSVNVSQLEKPNIYRLYYDALLYTSSAMQGQLKVYSFCIGIWTKKGALKDFLPHLCTRTHLCYCSGKISEQGISER